MFQWRGNHEHTGYLAPQQPEGMHAGGRGWKLHTPRGPFRDNPIYVQSSSDELEGS